MNHHPLLARQLRRAFGSVEAAPPTLETLLEQVSAAYQQFDQDRRLIEHVMEVSSRELASANASLLEQNRRNETLLARLRQTIDRLHPEGPVGGDEDLLQLADDIERLVTQHQAVEQALREAKDASDAANRAKSEFVANMSHEIRTPLNAVIGMTSILLDCPLAPSHRDYVEIIRQGGEGLLDIINDILDFSKIEAGRMELEFIPCDLRATVEQVLDLLSDRAVKSRLDLGVSFAPEIPACLVTDPTRLRQILVNLIGNALKFTHQGGVGVFVSARREDDAWRIEFVVEDTGIGIPTDRLDRLFKAFSQVDASTTRKFGGTGLGLAITHRLVDLMGGSIDVQSRPGEGSRFRFDLLAAACTEKIAAPPEDLAPLRGRRVLVVDDVAINRRILESQIAGWGFAVELANGPEHALATLAASAPFDVIVLDFNMPGMDGARLSRIIAERLGNKPPPMVLLSSRGAEADEAGALFDRRLTKPVKPTELRDVLAGLLSHSDARARPPARPSGVDLDFARRHPLRILVAEDVAVNRKVIQLYLGRLGYHPTSVGDGREVLQRMAEEEYDVILMDLQMPVLDGLDATRLIRAEPGRERHPYIIALTANVLTEHHESASASGMQDYLAKPLRAEALAVALRQAHGWLRDNPPPSRDRQLPDVGL